MALFKARNNRRSSSSPYTATFTTIILIAISVFCIWMLTSTNANTHPKHATTKKRMSIDTSSTHNDLSSSSDDSSETTVKIHDDQKSTLANLLDDVVSFDDKNLNVHADPEPLKEQSLISESQLSEESTLTQKQQASETNEAGVDINNYDKKMSESEKVQRSSVSENTEISEGNHEEEIARPQDENMDTITKEDKTTEDQIVNEGENQERDAGKQQEDVRSFDNQESKNEEDEQNKKQFTEEDEQNKKHLIEDKGEITEEDQKQPEHLEKQDDNSNQDQQEKQDDNTNQDPQEKHDDNTNQDPQENLDDNSNQDQHQKQDDSSNSFSDSDTQLSTSKDSQLESHAAVEGESSQLTQEELEQRETQKPELENKKKKKQMDEDKDVNQSKAGKPMSKESKKAWSTQADQSHHEKERQKDKESDSTESTESEPNTTEVHTWQLCNVTAGADYIPCLDNEKAVKKLRSTKHYEHRERHCPDDAPTCLVPLPKGYKQPIEWPGSRDKIWYYNVPHTLLAEVKGHQNWVKVMGEFLTFPGGGTQFIHGALHYIDFIQQAEAGIAWGKRTRVILDVGCGVGSFGGYLFERDVIAMSFAPKDEHVAQVQFALERGIPAISAVMGSQRLPFPSKVFDLVHCARCRVPWHAEGGLLLLELNRVLRPGGYFVWSATPVYQKLEEDVQIWNEMTALTKSMCWELVTISKDKLNSIGAAIFRKPTSNECYETRKESSPPICADNDDPNAAWYVPLQACLHRVPVDKEERGARWPDAWPNRLYKAPYWLNDLETGIYGKPASQDFVADAERWKNVVDEISNIGVTWSNVRNVMDMRAVYGGFAAALRDLPVWVFNVVNVDSPDTLPIIYERGLFGIYHDWCESFSTYPRTYDLLHADGLFSKLKKRCKLVPVIAEVDRIVRPGGKFIVRDEPETLGEVESLLNAMHWEISKNQEGLLCAKKGKWRPDSYVAVS